MWKFREQLSYFGKLRRSIYENLRDDMERRLIKMALIDSYHQFKGNGVEYRFVEKSELKPKSKKMEKESKFFNTFLVILCENVIKNDLTLPITLFIISSIRISNISILQKASISWNNCWTLTTPCSYSRTQRFAKKIDIHSRIFT